MWLRLIEFWLSLFPVFRRSFYRNLYQVVSRYIIRASITFMNYGYASLVTEEFPRLENRDERDRYPIQLYHHTASATDLSGKDVLEVGCGLGGGASYIARYLSPKSLIGVDISPNVISICSKIYHVPALSFQVGDAEDLPFPSQHFEVVLNIESSHCYGDMNRFLSEVVRVLRPGGWFLFCDCRDSAHFPELIEALSATKMEVARQQDITANVIRALEELSSARKSAIRKNIPWLFVRSFEAFAGVEGGPVFESLQSGIRRYISCAMRKPM